MLSSPARWLPLGLLSAALILLAAPASQASDDSDIPTVPPTVLVGVAGLAWSDINEADAPTILGLVDENGAANMSVRTVRTRACAVDGWLTISAGRRTADVSSDYCAKVPKPTPLPDGSVEAGRWEVLSDPPDAERYDAVSGVLGDTLAANGACATAVGPGAAIALAERDGVVPRYLPDVADLDQAEIADCPVTVIDAGFVPHLQEADEQAAVVRDLDALIADLVDLLPPDGTLLLAGISDSGPTPKPSESGHFLPDEALRLALGAGGQYQPAWLISASTRWEGVVQITDLTATLLEGAGVSIPADLAGAGWRNAGSHPSSGRDTVQELVDLDQAEKIFQKRYSAFYQSLGYIQAGVYGITLLVIGYRGPRGLSGPTIRPVQVVAYGAAALPVASFLTNLTGWWRMDHPELGLWSMLVLITAVVAVVAALGPWRRWLFGPPAFIATLTATVLAVDVLTGSTLQHLSLLGLSPTVAGRFYGFGNIPFAVFAASVLFAIAAFTQILRERGVSAPLQGGVVLLLGVPAALVVGSPNGGADFGGLLSLIPGVLVLALGVAGLQLTFRRLVYIGLISVLIVGIVSIIDWLRPPEDRSHLGDFVQSIIDGTAWTTVARKFEAMLGTLDQAYSWLVPVAYIAIWYLALSRRRPEIPALEELERRWPAFRTLIITLLITGAIGFAVNDSGLVVPAMLGSTAIPLAVIALVEARYAWLRRSTPAQPPPKDAPDLPVR